jgi:hypothetical protein
MGCGESLRAPSDFGFRIANLGLKKSASRSGKPAGDDPKSVSNLRGRNQG